MPRYSYHVTLKINAEILWSSYDRVIIIELAHVPWIKKIRQDSQALHSKPIRLWSLEKDKTKFYIPLGFLPRNTIVYTKGKEIWRWVHQSYKNERSRKQKWPECKLKYYSRWSYSERASEICIGIPLHSHEDMCRRWKKKKKQTFPRTHTELGKCFLSI